MLLKGLGNLSLDPRLYADGEAQIALNTDFSRVIGALKSARDHLVKYDRLGEITHISIYDGKLVVVASGTIRIEEIDNPVYTIGADNLASSINYRGKMYICNGDYFQAYDGSSFSNITITAPSSAASSAADGGSGRISSGEYYYVFTWRERSSSAPGKYRDESAPSSSITVTLSSSSRKITLSGLPTKTGYNLVIYRLSVGYSNLYNEVTEITDGSTTYSDNKLNEELGLNIETENYTESPLPKHIVLFNDNIFACGLSSWLEMEQKELDNVMVFSADRRPSGWDAYNYFVIGETDDRIMNIIPAGNSLAVYTRRKIFLVTGYSAESYTQQPSRAFTGLAGEYALCDTVVYGHLFLGSDKKLHRFDGVSIDDPPALRKVDELFSKWSTHQYRANWNYIENSRMTFFDGKAYLSYPGLDQKYPNLMLVMDFNQWPEIIFSVQEKAINVFYPDLDNNILYAGNKDGEIFEVNGGDTFLPVTYRTKEYQSKSIHLDSLFNNLMCDYNSLSQDITVKVYLDDILNTTITLNKAARKTKDIVYKSFKSPAKGRRISFEFSWNAPSHDVTIYDMDIDRS